MKDSRERLSFCVVLCEIRGGMICIEEDEKEMVISE